MRNHSSSPSFSQSLTSFAALAILGLISIWPGTPLLNVGAQNATLSRNNGPDTYAITNARIVSVSGPTIERGTVIIRNGLIAAVGENVTAPADARPIDGTGLTVYPGLIDANTTLAIPRPSPTPTPAAGGGLAGLFGPGTPPSAISPNSTQLPGLQPEIMAADIIRPGGTEIESARNAGITAALTAPRGNIFLGQSALINLAGDTPQQMIVSSPVALHVGFTGLAAGQYPGSLMGVFASIRQALLDAQRYREANAIYERSPRGLRRPGQDKSLAALQPVLARQMPVVMQAEREREIIRALDLAQEFNLQLIIAGGGEAYKVADRLKQQKVPVLLSLNFPRRTTAATPDVEPEPLRVLRERAEAPKTAGRLAAAGVQFAFQSGQMTNISDYLGNAQKTIENGLSREQALRALTIGPAEILGVADRMGSIEVGKIANLTVTRGDLFDKNRRITHVFIDGRPVDLKPPKPEGPGATVSGTWQLKINLGTEAGSEVEFAITLNVQQQGERLTGSMQGQLGSGQIANGSVSGSDIRFSAPVTLTGAGSQTTEALFNGAINGNEISGTVQIVGRGPGSFTGTRAGNTTPAAPPPSASPTPTPGPVALAPKAAAPES
jgi:imidazolonepropionase-like amidohydrolase